MSDDVPQERRTQTLRRQVNASFLDPFGNVAITKMIAVFAQIAVLYHFGKHFERLIDRPEVLAILLAFLIAPDVVKKWLSMRLGNGAAPK